MSTLSISLAITCLQTLRTCIDQVLLHLQDSLRRAEPIPDVESGRPTPTSTETLFSQENTRQCTKCLHGRRRPCYDQFTTACFYHLTGPERDQRGLPRSYQ
jgi:hypothetical protein